MAIVLSDHAEVAIRESGLSLDWVERAIADPDLTTPDAAHPMAIRSFKHIREAGGRVLRVVHRPQGLDVFIITAYFEPQQH